MGISIGIFTTQNFSQTLFTLFRAMLFVDWTELIENGRKFNGFSGLIFWISFYLVVIVVVLNLLLAVILDAYQVLRATPQNMQLEVEKINGPFFLKKKICSIFRFNNTLKNLPITSKKIPLHFYLCLPPRIAPPPHPSHPQVPHPHPS
jgi:hypothetical protein